ncbi:MAG: EscU/YscU/HrcU family type III secretion system export apparatus switch protein [Gammaproteobacteria bacterium]|nr:EscU/YscU/HrcU family type III secretion system export apparatus switch protein [Gammaproteobacteria bacterium]
MSDKKTTSPDTTANKPPNKAVALKYELDSAPKVVAKGEGQIADKIIEIAEEHGVVLYQDSELVKLLSKIDVDSQIPSNLYQAVAVVLSFVFQLNGKDKEITEKSTKNIKP